MLIHITKGTGKMENIPSINSSSLQNEFCQAMAKHKELICSKCYSNQLAKMRPTLEKKLIYNTELLSNPLYEPEFINHAFLRFHSFGELANSTMLHNMIKLAKFNPHCQFVLWTKRIDIIRAYYKDRFYPDNFRVIYSNPRIDSPMTESDIPEGFHAVFNVFSAEYAIQHNIDINCSGKSCQTCMNCYKSVKMPNKIINEVIKSQAKKYQSSNPA